MLSSYKVCLIVGYIVVKVCIYFRRSSGCRVLLADSLQAFRRIEDIGSTRREKKLSGSRNQLVRLV